MARKVALVAVVVSLEANVQMQVWSSMVVVMIAWSLQLLYEPMIDCKAINTKQGNNGEKPYLVESRILDFQVN